MAVSPDKAKKKAQETAVRLVTASASSVVGITIVYPIERVKLILQNQDSNIFIQTGQWPRYKGIMDVVRRVPSEQGLSAFWRGCSIIVYRYIPQHGLNFTIYNYYMRALRMFNVGRTPELFLAGAGAGITTNCLLYPLLFCQTRLSTDFGSGGSKGGGSGGKHLEREFNGLFDCVAKIKKADGWKGIYAGFIPSTIANATMRAFFFGFFDFGKMQLADKYGGADKIPVYLLFPIAQMATVIGSILSYPPNTICTRMMLQAGKPEKLREYRGMMECASKLYHEGGIPIFFRGCFVNLFRGLGGAIALILNDKVLEYVLPMIYKSDEDPKKKGSKDKKE